MTDELYMKRLSIFFMVALAGVLMMASCEPSDEVLPDKSVREEFAAKYPDAKDIEWDREGTYWKVSFDTGSGAARKEHEAWYSADGSWLWTETDLYLSEVPSEIMGYLAESIYGDSDIDGNDAEYVETPTSNYYRFEIIYGGIELIIKVDEEGHVGIGGIER